MKRHVLTFTAPRRVELREESLPALGADDVLVETVCSAVSAGTEMLIYRGRFPRDIELDSVISALRGPCEYPLAYGYAVVGVVRETGTQVDRSWHGRRVFSFQPHTSHFVAQPESLLSIPDTLLTESACFLPNMETAVNLVQDAAPILGERVMVFGQGVVGLLTTALLREFPLETLMTADCYELRRRASLEIGAAMSFDPNAPDFRSRIAASLGSASANPGKGLSGYAHGGFDLTLELSGNPSALDDAIALTAFSGRVVIGSWYGEKRASLDLGGAFHRSRIRLISSQVSTVAPELSARWDKARRFAVAWNALQRIQPQKWITHRFPISQAAQAYKMLDENPQETIQILFHYT